MARTYPTVLDLVGGTPVVRLVSFGKETGATLLAKLEFMNPGGSNKDRIGLAMIEDSEPVDQRYLDAGTWDVEIAGRRYPITLSMRPLYDPASARVRG